MNITVCEIEQFKNAHILIYYFKIRPGSLCECCILVLTIKHNYLHIVNFLRFGKIKYT